jgi:uncharacterized protein (TIGR03085 family)
MGMASIERAELADLCEEVGPDAPTLCEGWATRDLAAHLVLREGRPDASVGIALKPLAGWTAHVQRGLATTDDWHGLVERFRTGPPTLSFFRLPGVDESWNGFEVLVHHEDVRRARPGWEPRTLPAKAEAAVWSRLAGGAAKMFFRNATTGVTLRRPDGTSLVAHPGEPTVVIVGDPVELVMYAFGRREHARVTVEADPETLERFSASSLGL